jgi:hypothetical protein
MRPASQKVEPVFFCHFLLCIIGLKKEAAYARREIINYTFDVYLTTKTNKSCVRMCF